MEFSDLASAVRHINRSIDTFFPFSFLADRVRFCATIASDGALHNFGSVLSTVLLDRVRYLCENLFKNNNKNENKSKRRMSSTHASDSDWYAAEKDSHSILPVCSSFGCIAGKCDDDKPQRMCIDVY